MFDFIRKDALFAALDRETPRQLNAPAPFHLKTIQDCIVFDRLREARGLDIAEIGGGDSRLLRALAASNRCVNIEPFDGQGGGPRKEIAIRGVTNIRVLLGEHSPALADAAFDIVFSISVIEHIPYRNLSAFFEDGMRILRPGGLWLHAVDVYLGDSAADTDEARFAAYRSWVDAAGLTTPEGAVFDGPPVFTSDMASNPDNVMHDWGRVAPGLIERRKKLQCVSVILAARKTPPS